jgi:hypothetical protein
MSATFSPDGRQIATASADGTAKVWEARTGECLFTLNGHSDQVMSVSFSPDGRRIVTGSRDQKAKLWDAKSGKELLTLKGHRGWVITVAFSPDGQRIVTASSDGTAKVWKAASVEEVARWREEEKFAGEARLRHQADEAAAAAEQARNLRAKLPGKINRWLVLLPIPFDGTSGAYALQREQLAREGQLRPRVNQRIKAGRNELVWREIASEDYLLDFNQIAGREAPFSVAYAVCYVESPSPQTNLVLQIGSDDQSKVFLNEREVYRTTNAYGWEADRDTVSGIDLKAGLNVLVFKVVNQGGGWAGSIRITDATGQPVNGLRLTLPP